jgi:CPA1 family monovalent cation:H+ antiporter
VVNVPDTSALQVLVLLGLAVLVLTMLAGRIGLPPPILLLVGGVALAFVPWLEHVRLPPEVVLLLFLPALLYWESLNTSLREIRANLTPVLIDSILLVLATAGVVAVVGHAIGLSWPVAWVLGAVVAPTDATAVAAVASRMPRRQITILRAESLINDGTALVVFAIAVDVAARRVEFSWAGAVGSFALSYLGGASVGLVLAWVATRVRRLTHTPVLENTVSVLTPFAAFLLAERLHASGVLAVVVCGLAVSQLGPRLIAAHTRVLSRAFWQLTTFVLNSALFVLVGLQLRGAVTGLVSYSIGAAVLAALQVSAAVIGTRLGWMYTVPYLIRLVHRRPRQDRLNARHRLPIAWSGFRGGVSLAAALAVPVTADGARFPGRDLIIVVTFGVILVTLLVQGLTLPAVLRWSRLPEDHSERAEKLLAERVATQSAIAALPATASRLGVSDGVRDRLRADLDERLAALADPDDENDSDDTGPDVRQELADYRRLHAALLDDKRAALVRLRDARVIDDIVLRRIQARLDAEEVRLSNAVDAGEH